MCRLFGFRSTIQSQVHRSLTEAENALAVQSKKHPNGWGIAYYIEGFPHLIRSAQTALNCKIFERVSGVVSSNTVMAHIRRATLGKANIVNTHPFQFGNWTFAHNGNIAHFAQIKDDLMARISPSFKRFILGETDSEVIFYFILSHLHTLFHIHNHTYTIEELSQGVRESVKLLIKYAGQYSQIDDGDDSKTYYTFLLSNGSCFLAHQGGKTLYYSTYKTRCSERQTCPHFAPECEAPSKSGHLNHFVLSSEPLGEENVWIPLKPGQMVGVDAHMQFKKENYGEIQK